MPAFYAQTLFNFWPFPKHLLAQQFAADGLGLKRTVSCHKASCQNGQNNCARKNYTQQFLLARVLEQKKCFVEVVIILQLLQHKQS